MNALPIYQIARMVNNVLIHGVVINVCALVGITEVAVSTVRTQSIFLHSEIQGSCFL